MEDMPSDHYTIAQALESALEWWDEAGVDTPAITPPKRQVTAKPPLRPTGRQQILGKPAQTTSPKTIKPAPLKTPSPNEIEASAIAAAGAAPTLDALKSVITHFDAEDITANASQSVFARGNPQARIMFIGDAPGREEDAVGKPFMGPTGQLLDRMLAAIGLDETSAYITNVCNWRPLNGRSPTAEEIAINRPFINRHIELLAPKIIVLVGSVALETLTGEKGITKQRGQWKTLDIKGQEQDVKTIPLYHPAFLLRRPELKADAWRDLLSIKSALDTL